MPTRRDIMLAAGTALLTGPARAQNYPSRPIRILVGYPAGGGVDLVARLLSDPLRTLGQTVIVENRPGASAMLAAQAVATAVPDGHMLLANSKALALAGITAKTPDPPGGVIVRDASGEPTGALKDAATELLQKAQPPLNLSQRRRAVESALHEAAMQGVTSVQDMSLDYGDLQVYSQMLADGKLTVRVYGAPLIANVEDQAKLGIGHAFGGPSLRIGALKMFADGSLGSRTAYFTAPSSANGVPARTMRPNEAISSTSNHT